MADVLTIPQILNIAKLAQSLAQNDAAIKTVLNGGSLDDNLGGKIFLERMIVQAKYDKNPSDSTLRGTANYLYELLGQYAITAQNIINGTTGAVPIVSGPSNQTVNLGDQATFTIMVTSTLLYSVKWFKNSVEVPGQTGNSYSFTPQQSDNGDQIYAVVTNAIGSTTSSTATLTVNVSLTAYAAYIPETDPDPYPIISGGTDNYTYQISQAITHNQPISFTLPSGSGNNNRWIFRVPIGEALFNHYQNGPFIQGNFNNDFNFYNPVIQNTLGYTYYISRSGLSFDISQPFQLSSI